MQQILGFLENEETSDEDCHYHKRMVTRFVFPAMFALSIGVIVTTFSFETRVLIGIFGVSIPCMIFNTFLVTKNRKFRVLGQNFESFSDGAFAARWLITLIFFDVPVMLLLQPSEATHMGFWSILLLACFADNYHRRYRWLIVGLGLAIALMSAYFLYPDQRIIDRVFLGLVLVLLMMIFTVMENFWHREINAKNEAKQKEIEASKQADSLRKDATHGHMLRVVSHEVGNILAGMTLELKNPNREQASASIENGIDQLKDMCGLVLGELFYTGDNPVQRVRVSQIVERIEMLVRKQVEFEDIKFSLDCASSAMATEVVERKGSIFSIIQNLVINSCTAIKAKHGDKRELGPASGLVQISIEKKIETLVMSIIDDGCGIDTSSLSMIRKKEVPRSGGHGNGIGLQVFFSEVDRNGFGFDVDSEVGRYTQFDIKIPLIGEKSTGNIGQNIQ